MRQHWHGTEQPRWNGVPARLAQESHSGGSGSSRGGVVHCWVARKGATGSIPWEEEEEEEEEEQKTGLPPRAAPLARIETG